MRTARATLFAAALVAVTVSACGREPLEWECPEVGPGDLVLTEIRGPQQDAETVDWFEIYNATDRELDLYGTQIRFRRPDGSNPRTIIVRRPGVVVDANDYAVLGGAPAEDAPEHVDYGYASDFSVGLYSSAVVDVSACGEAIDDVYYENLPDSGSLAFDGDLEPDAELNSDTRSDESPWCTDTEIQADTGLVGTPGETNRQCPE